MLWGQYEKHEHGRSVPVQYLDDFDLLLVRLELRRGFGQIPTGFGLPVAESVTEPIGRAVLYLPVRILAERQRLRESSVAAILPEPLRPRQRRPHRQMYR